MHIAETNLIIPNGTELITHPVYSVVIQGVKKLMPSNTNSTISL